MNRKICKLIIPILTFSVLFSSTSLLFQESVYAAESTKTTNEVRVSTFSELKDEIENFSYEEYQLKGINNIKTIVITEDITFTESIEVNKSIRLVGEEGKDIVLTGNDSKKSMLEVKGTLPSEEGVENTPIPAIVKIENLTFEKNSESVISVDNVRPNGELSIENVNFRDNKALNGGAIRMNPVDTYQVSIKNSNFDNNVAQEYGGAIYAENRDSLIHEEEMGSLNLTISACSFGKNFSELGGGSIYYNGKGGAGGISIDGGNFNNNSTNGNGGAIGMENFFEGGGLGITDDSGLNGASKFYNNTAKNGGAISLKDFSFSYFDATPDLEDIVFESNKAENGGAIYQENRSGGGFEISNVIFKENIAESKDVLSGYGGAIDLNGNNKLFDGYELTYEERHSYIENSKFIDNKASSNGGAVAIYREENYDVIEDSDTEVYEYLEVEGSEFKGNFAENGAYFLDKIEYPNLTNLHSFDLITDSDKIGKIRDCELLSLDSEYAYNNYDISFVSDYRVIYDGNGNTSGTAPIDTDSPYKKGSDVKVLDNKDLSKSGYKFEAWNTSADGTGIEYNSGDKFEIEGHTRLYAQWSKIPSTPGTEDLYEVKYDANTKNYEGKVPVDENKYKENEEVKVLSNGELSRKGYTFEGWNTKADGTGTSYKSEEKFNITKDTTLYAQWSKDILDKVNHNAYLIGYPDGTVKSDGNITRAETSAIYFRLMTDDAREELWRTKNNYTDVVKEAWYNNEVSTLSNAKIVKGYPEGDFRPDGDITRAEFASMTARFLSDKVKAPEGKLNDISGHWAEEDINKLVSAGIIQGYEDGSFKPEQSITRAESSKIVNGILERTPHKDGLLEDMKVWPDNNEKAWYYVDIQEATNSHEYERKTVKDSEKWTKLIDGRDWIEYEKELEEKLGSK